MDRVGIFARASRRVEEISGLVSFGTGCKPVDFGAGSAYPSFKAAMLAAIVSGKG